MGVDSAFKAVDRANFVREDTKPYAHFDTALSIGHGQTISQPFTVRLMLEWLDARPGQKVLDVGSGSGWSTALLSHIVGTKGKVYAVEKIPVLVEFGRQNCKRVGIKNAEFHEAGQTYGLPKHMPFDRILVSAAASQLPNELVEQLKIGGKMVIPIGYSIFEVTRMGEDDFEAKEHEGFIFVPLI